MNPALEVTDAAKPPRPSLRREQKVAAFIYVSALIVYASVAGPRLRAPSSDIHFSYLADMFLHHRLDLGHAPPNSNDWAEVEYLHLKDGRTVAGAYLRSLPGRFKMLDGQVEAISNEQIQNRWKKYYVSFPPFPAVLFLPFVALFGLAVKDVLLTAVLAALSPALLFLILRRLSQRGDSQRSEADDLLLTLLFGIGTVYFYSSVIGQVWYTAHIVATVLSALFILCSFEAAHPFAAGICLGALVLTRPQIGFLGLFFLFELWRAHRAGRAALLSRLVKVALPVVAFAIVGAAFNWARFGAFGEFGHKYLNVRWTDRIQKYGLFNLAFLPRNLSVALALTPKFTNRVPFFQLSWHGMSMLLTTPAFGYLVWPRVTGGSHRSLWLTVAPIAIMGLMYQNDGWVQFGYRFSLDFTLLLVMLLAVGGRPFTRTFKLFVLIGVAVNLFGAISFGRMWQFYVDSFFPIGLGEL